MKEKIIDWLCNSTNKGRSSEAMATAFLDRELKHMGGFSNHPLDPADFNRCLLFLNAVPEARNHMYKIASLSDTWKKLVDNWDELEKCFIDEVGLDWEKGDRLYATKTSKMMKSFGC